MRVVADSHAIVWYIQDSERLGTDAAVALADAEATDGIVVSADDLARLRSTLEASRQVDLHPVDLAVADNATAIPRDVLSDPWDRFIVATARALDMPLVTRDERIRAGRLVETIWW